MNEFERILSRIERLEAFVNGSKSQPRNTRSVLARIEDCHSRTHDAIHQRMKESNLSSFLNTYAKVQSILSWNDLDESPLVHPDIAREVVLSSENTFKDIHSQLNSLKNVTGVLDKPLEIDTKAIKSALESLDMDRTHVSLKIIHLVKEWAAILTEYHQYIKLMNELFLQYDVVIGDLEKERHNKVESD